MAKFLRERRSELFTRRKHDANFPVQAVRCCLKGADSTLKNLPTLVLPEYLFVSLKLDDLFTVAVNLFAKRPLIMCDGMIERPGTISRSWIGVFGHAGRHKRY
jgi:hypothetical protein